MEISRISNNKLRLCRRCVGYSRKKVARMIGLADTSALSRWERGLATPGIVQAFRLARIYRILPHQLYETLWETIDQEVRLLALAEERITSNQ